MTRLLVRAAGAAFLLTTTLGSAPPAAAQQADALFSGFEPSGSWLLTVNGKDLPKAEIYENQRAAALLIRSAEFGSPLLLDVGGREVSAVNLMKFSVRADGRVDLLADAVLEPVASFEFTGGEARFTVEGKAAMIKPGPYLLGAQKGASLLESNFGYRWRAKSYEPDASAAGRLRGEKRDVRVLTFFGTWCPHCSRYLPLLLKLEQRLADGKIRFDYHGLPQQGMTSEPEAAKWKVDGVPTAIVLVGGKEVGRIPATGWTNPELALDLILHPERASG